MSNWIPGLISKPWAVKMESLEAKLKNAFPTVLLRRLRSATIQNKTRRPALHGESVRLRVDSSLGKMPRESCMHLAICSEQCCDLLTTPRYSLFPGPAWINPNNPWDSSAIPAVKNN